MKPGFLAFSQAYSFVLCFCVVVEIVLKETMTATGVRILENVPVMVRQTVQESLFGQCRCMILMFIVGRNS